jgi:hypothetical protein
MLGEFTNVISVGIKKWKDNNNEIQLRAASIRAI